eukprot:CAMPEP_0172683374 /NCGR_PEP_ID=MMETSP1074-20121228/18805_1 /TAXON_ID=2916 /ORGANISM="Ceratium fusus, Strain PA161109" /LENGTH=75 /DNA_ID=CAMNT_0013502211 /DNA_START=208 /DNA_END=432 /DNA_ORIENTATION=+
MGIAGVAVAAAESAACFATSASAQCFWAAALAIDERLSPAFFMGVGIAGTFSAITESDAAVHLSAPSLRGLPRFA